MTPDVLLSTTWATVAGITQPCPDCDGVGTFNLGRAGKPVCDRCDGTGRVSVFPDVLTLPEPLPNPTGCTCSDTCDAEGEPGCRYCQTADPELPCPAEEPFVVGLVVGWYPDEATAIETAIPVHVTLEDGEVCIFPRDALHFGEVNHRVGEVVATVTVTDCQRVPSPSATFLTGEPYGPDRYRWHLVGVTPLDQPYHVDRPDNRRVWPA